MPPDRDYFCDCARYCQHLQKVSRRTYFAHATYRRNQIQSALDNYLGLQNVQQHVAIGQAVPLEHEEDEPDEEGVSDNEEMGEGAVLDDDRFGSQGDGDDRSDQSDWLEDLYIDAPLMRDEDEGQDMMWDEEQDINLPDEDINEIPVSDMSSMY